MEFRYATSVILLILLILFGRWAWVEGERVAQRAHVEIQGVSQSGESPLPSEEGRP